MVKDVFLFVGGVSGEVRFVWLQDGVSDVGILVFVAGSDEKGNFFVKVDAHTNAGFPHRAGFGAVNHMIHFFGNGRNVPFKAVPHVGIEHGHELGFGEVYGDIQVDGDKGRVLPKVKTCT